MSLRNRDRLIWIGLITAWVLCWVRYPISSDWKWKLLSWLVVIVIGAVFSNILGRRPLRLFRAALATEDTSAARREHANLVDFWRRGRAVETLKAYHVNILLLEENYQEALNELRALNLDKLAKNSAPMVQNQIAWCHMQLGDPEKGLQIAQSAFTGLENMGPDYSLSGHAVVGIGHFLLGRPSEAVPHLERAYAGSAHLPGIRASAAFYLGESLSALGRREEAKEAYQRAQGALPNSRDGMRAAERLKVTP